MRRKPRSILDDERAIEGLPIRLVIALVVGVASLALMLQVLDGFGDVGETEVTVEFDNRTFDLSDTDDITIDVVDEDGDPVDGATLIFEPDTAQGDIYQEDLGDNENEVTINDIQGELDADLRSDQNTGEYTVSVQPPSDSDYVDEQDNPQITFLNN